MKNKTAIFLLTFLAIFFTGGSVKKAMAEDEIIDTSQLVIRFTAKYTGSIGWGDVYKCRILEVCKGNLEDTVIILYISVNNYNSVFMRETPEKKQKSPLNQFLLIGKFRQCENDKPYVNFKNAFIDQKKRTWELFDLTREKDQ
ncbi:MAG TPA: hypothetical protein PKW80_12505 [Bacteroidales bacterium]|nr:hypothetical protein [Bacteroidales bacterium]